MEKNTTTKQPLEDSKGVTVRKFSVSVRPVERYSDPRELQVDLDADWVNTKNHPDKSIHSDRVMPMTNYKKFVTILSRKTKCFKGINDSHFWVSGYYAIHFYLKDKRDRLKMKKFVIEAVKESGGFMSFEEWYKEHCKPRTRIMQFNGTGSGITKTFDNLNNSIAFL